MPEISSCVPNLVTAYSVICEVCQHALACTAHCCFTKYSLSVLYLSICPSWILVFCLNEWIYCHFLDHHFWAPLLLQNTKGNPISRALNAPVLEIHDFVLKMLFIWETVRDRAMVIIDHQQEVLANWSESLRVTLKGRMQGGPFFPADLRSYARTSSLCRTTKFSTEHVEGACFYGSLRPHPKGQCSSIPRFLLSIPCATQQTNCAW